MGLSIGTLFPLRLRLWLGRLLFRRELGPSTVRVSWHRIIKGPCDPSELEAMQFVAARTSIPVPRVHRIHTPPDGSLYIEMAYVPGEPLSRAWHGLTTAERDAVFADIRRHVASLRALPPPFPADMVCSALQNPARDCRIGAQLFGPMRHDEFHALTRARLRAEDIPLLGGDGELAQVHTVARYETRFTHADLSPYNILVRDARVVAIIDWAFAGWYPAYWEYTKAHYNYFAGRDWEAYLARALHPHYEAELAAERLLWERLPEPGTSRHEVWDGGRSKTTRQGSRPAEAWLVERAGRDEPQDLWTRCLAWHGISAHVDSQSAAVAILKPSPPPAPNSNHVAPPYSGAVPPRQTLPGRVTPHPRRQGLPWGILASPAAQHGCDTHTFAASDASAVDAVTFRLTNPTMDWFLDAKGLAEPRGLVDPARSSKLVGRLVVGAVPEDVAADALHAFFTAVPLPVKNTHPQQSCVTWVAAAVERLQERGWVRGFDVARMMEDALAYADDRNSQDPTEPEVKYYGPGA